MLIPKDELGTYMPAQEGHTQLWKKGSHLYAATPTGNYVLMQEITQQYPPRKKSRNKK